MTLDVDTLLKELTIEEKLSLLAGSDWWHTVEIPRLNIPSVRVSDGPNGIRGTKFLDSIPSNCFPCGTAMAASFDKDLLVEIGTMMGIEAKAKGAHCILGPTCNIVRSPLGGRAFESYLEDPVLSGFAAAKIIEGIQSTKILACIKHFVANDQEAERKGVDARITERALREIYIKPFQIAIRDSNPRSLMTAYNKVNGVHASQNKKLLQDVLRKEFNWDGLIMSDWFGVYSTKESLDAGLNLEMPGPTRFRSVVPTAHKVYCRELHRDVVDDNAAHVLNFVSEFLETGIPPNAPEGSNSTQEARDLLRKAGANTVVLLKNSTLLPLPKKVSNGYGKIAVIGPNAKAARISGGGSASLNAEYTVTPFDGIAAKLKGSGIDILYAQGTSLELNLPDIGHLLRTADGSVGIDARYYREPPSVKSREVVNANVVKGSHIFLSDLPGGGLGTGERLFYAQYEGTYKHTEATREYVLGCSVMGTAQVFVNNKLVVDNKTKQVRGSNFFLGLGSREERNTITFEKGKTYVIRVEFGSSATSTLPHDSADIGGVYFGFAPNVDMQDEFSEAVDVARNADVVILVVGLSKEWESEGFDRPIMDIPRHTNELVERISAVNKNIVVVNQSGSPVTIPWIDKVSSFVQAWYGGNEVGNAIADVLFGDVNPLARLPMTFPLRLEDTPLYFNYELSKGRVLYGEDVYVGYRYYEKTKREVLFPFGFGLSYTTFEFSGLAVKTDGKNVTATVTVKNTGAIDGAESVQLYVSQEETTITRPLRELKAFEKVFLKAGEAKKVTVEVSVREAASYWDEYYNKWSVEKGVYHVELTNGNDNSLRGSFVVEQDEKWLGLK